MTKFWKLDKISKYFIMRRLVLIIKLEELRTKPNQKEKFSYTTSEVEDIKLLSPLEVEGEISYIEDEIFVRGHYRVKVGAPCVKCLKEVAISLDGEYDGHYSEGEKYSKHMSSLKKECDIKENYLEEAVHGEIDITELVREFIILDMPPYPACEPACDGLEEMEKYSKDDVDPRWQELLNLKN